MPSLTANQESFITLMQKSEEHSRKGFELLVKQSGSEKFFDALADAGLFDPKHNPGPVSADDPGYVRIPYWSALDYLEAVAKLSGYSNDLPLAEKVMGVVRNVSSAREPDGSIRDNYHTWRKFGEIIGLVPTDAVAFEDLGFIPGWLKSRFERGLVAIALDEGVLKKSLASDSPDDLEKACRILDYCTGIQWEEEKYGGGRKKPVTVVDDHWLKKLIGHHANSFGAKIGKEASQIFRDRVREVFRVDSRKLPSYVERPAVEDHEQNKRWQGAENCTVEGLRDVLLSWIDHDISRNPVSFVNEILNDDNEMVRRIGIFVLGKRWERLNGLYADVVAPDLFSSRNIHEMYSLLREHFMDFSDSDKAATLEALRDLPLPEDDEAPEKHLHYTQRNWLSAITGHGYGPAESWYSELMADGSLGRVSQHPDFHYYMESWVGSGPSPYSVQELLAFAADGMLINILNDFQTSNDWRGPSTAALVKTLEEAIGANPEIFLRLLSKFLSAKRSYQYGVINGFKRLWDGPQDNNVQLDWGVAWDKLLSFFANLLNAEDFWSEAVVEEKDLMPTKNWIPSAIAEFLQAGTKKDEHAFSEDLLPKSFSLIVILLKQINPVSEANDDAMMQAINSEKGKAIEALFNHALRVCRVNDKLTGDHLEAWALIKHVFDEELSKCTDTNYEFSTLAGAYLSNLEYVSSEWLKANFGEIFPQAFQTNFLCAVDGLTYCSTTRSIYGLLVEHEVLDRALQLDFKRQEVRKRLVERIALAYLWGDEQLDSPRFAFMFEKGLVEDLKDVSDFFWSVREQELSDDQIRRVLEFWVHCATKVRSLSEPPVQLMSSLSRLSGFVQTLSGKEMDLMLDVAPFVSVAHNADDFIEELDRLLEEYPSEVSSLLGKVLENYKPSYDYQDRLKNLLTRLAGNGKRDDALRFTDQLRYLSGFNQLFKTLTERV